jgi:succinate dehydrogenase / fumarate reductase cytochrome b subunit
MAKAQGAGSAKAAKSPPPAERRPLSPHVSVWRWHVTMLGSILHRFTGMSNYLGAILVVGWLFAAASGPEAYARYAAIAGSPLGQLLLFGFTVGITYHLANGVRHLVWDTGVGLNPRTASATGYLVLAVGVVGASAIWAAAGLIPGVPGFAW